MCSSNCGVNALLEDGIVKKLEGIPDHPVSKGFICRKGRAGKDILTDPRRLRNPLRRVGKRGEGKWQEITWTEALNEIASRLLSIKRNYGAQAIAYYRGHPNEWGINWDFAIRFMNALGSPTISTSNHLCHVPRMLAHKLTYGGMPAPDIKKARCIVIWGCNPFWTRPYKAAAILKAFKRGAKLIVIDSRRNELARAANLFLQVRPGTDGALALGMLNIIIQENLYDHKFIKERTIGFEKLKELVKEYPPEKVEQITWVPANLIIEAARVYAAAKPACLQDGNGLDQHTNVVNTNRAIACLIAITGNLDVPGGNLFLPSFKLEDLSLGYLRPEKSPLLNKFPFMGQGRYAMIPPPVLLQAMVNGASEAVRALIVQGGALVEGNSDSARVAQSLRQLDFLVVHELYMTGTAQLADLVLPAASYLERHLLYTYPPVTIEDNHYHVISLQRPVCPTGQCLSDQAFIFAMAEKLGLKAVFPWHTDLEAIKAVLEPTTVTVEELLEKPWVIVPAGKHTYKKYERTGFATGSGKVELWSDDCAVNGYDGLPVFHEPAESPVQTPEKYIEYPIIANTGLKPAEYTQTMFRTLPDLAARLPEPWLEIHPETAVQYGIDSGDLVEVESARGKIRIKAQVTKDVMPGVIFISYGWGQPYAQDINSSLVTNTNLNLLTDSSYSDPISGTTSNRSILVRLRKIVP